MTVQDWSRTPRFSFSLSYLSHGIILHAFFSGTNCTFRLDCDLNSCFLSSEFESYFRVGVRCMLLGHYLRGLEYRLDLVQLFEDSAKAQQTISQDGDIIVWGLQTDRLLGRPEKAVRWAKRSPDSVRVRIGRPTYIDNNPIKLLQPLQNVSALWKSMVIWQL